MSKLNGRNKRVIGNSFIMSTNTRTPPAMIDGRINGIVIEEIVPKKFTPSVLLAQIKFGDVFSKPDITEPYPTARKRIR